MGNNDNQNKEILNNEISKLRQDLSRTEEELKHKNEMINKQNIDLEKKQDKIDNLTQKLEKKQEKISSLKEIIQNKEEVSKGLKIQIKNLEQSILLLKAENDSLIQEEPNKFENFDLKLFEKQKDVPMREGSFGSVSQVKNSQTGKTYAMKSFNQGNSIFTKIQKEIDLWERLQELPQRYKACKFITGYNIERNIYHRPWRIKGNCF